MSALKLKEMLSSSTSLMRFWKSFSDYFFSGKWLSVKGGYVQGSPTGIVIDLLSGSGDVSYPFSATIKEVDSVYSVVVNSGNIDLGVVNCAYPFPSAPGVLETSFSLVVSSSVINHIVLKLAYSSNAIDYNGVSVNASITAHAYTAAEYAALTHTATSTWVRLASTMIVESKPEISFSRDQHWSN